MEINGECGLDMVKPRSCLVKFCIRFFSSKFSILKCQEIALIALQSNICGFVILAMTPKTSPTSKNWWHCWRWNTAGARVRTGMAYHRAHFTSFRQFQVEQRKGPTRRVSVDVYSFILPSVTGRDPEVERERVRGGNQSLTVTRNDAHKWH